MISRKEQIDQIISHFDWGRVHKAMVALNWKWCSSSMENSIPSIGELIVCATGLLNDVSPNDTYRATGGFKATCDINGYLGLEFIVSEWNIEEYEE